MKQSFFLKESKFKKVFLSLKIFSLFFCSIPYFQHFLKEKTIKYAITHFSTNLITFFMLLIALTFVWLFLDNRENSSKLASRLEIVVFFMVCATSVYFSGCIKSYYKFIFIFMIVLYTIEFGKKVGETISIVASVAILGSDLIFYSEPGVNYYFENDISLCAMFLVVAWALSFYVDKASSHISMLTDYANIDELTGLYNHRYFYEQLKESCRMSLVTGLPLSLLILDVDYFKIYNDTFGHQKGDVLLKELSRILINELNDNHLVCRYGGDEITIILHNSNINKAIDIANHLRHSISKHTFDGEERLPTKNVTVTVGVAEFKGEKDTYTALFKRVDFALYRAKYLRRNSVQEYTSVFDHLNTDSEDNHIMRETMNSLKALINIIDLRDSYTFKHTDRVVMLCMKFAEHVGLSTEDKRRLCYSAYLHDLGKINISKEVLISDKILTPAEWEELKRHPEESAAIISKMDGLEDIVPIVRHHHERYDGTGYPDKIKGENIEYLARILALADSFDAMTNIRPYQETKTFEQAFEEIERCSGTQFDPVLAKQLIEAIRANDISQIARAGK